MQEVKRKVQGGNSHHEERSALVMVDEEEEQRRRGADKAKRKEGDPRSSTCMGTKGEPCEEVEQENNFHGLGMLGRCQS